MSKPVRPVIKLLEVLLQGALGMLLWIVCIPLSWIIPRKRNLLVVIGRDDGLFSDNTKYFFLQAVDQLQGEVRCVFVTAYPQVTRLLRDSGYEVFQYPGIRAIWMLLRAGCLIVDSVDWPNKGRRYFLHGSKCIQLWHGVGFKRIGLSGFSNPERSGDWIPEQLLRVLRRNLLRFRGRDCRSYHLVAVTSRFYRDQVFKQAFDCPDYVLSGYPRNGFGKGLSEKAATVVEVSLDPAISDYLPSWRSQGRRLILVAPTFRETRKTPMNIDRQTLKQLDEWCQTHDATFIFKFHPWEVGTHEIRGEHLHVCEQYSDIYPLMPYFDAMVTDYSSIYMDYLLVDKPIIFYTPDLQEYLSKDRNLQFPYEDMTPGPKVETWPELLRQLEYQWLQDEYTEKRSRLRTVAFDDINQEHATSHILAEMQRQGWLSVQCNKRDQSC